VVTPTWFAVLPDSAAGENAARMMGLKKARVIHHASGRPWLVGDWPDEQVRHARIGNVQVAVIGRCPVTATTLSAALKVNSADHAADVERLARSLPGNFHTVAAIDGGLWMRGTLSGTRRIFHTVLAGATVAADRADILAAASGAPVHEEALALRLLCPTVYFPMEEQSLWRGVHAVPGERCLVVDPDGRARTPRWFRAPAPVLSLAEGAGAVRTALTSAVRTCSEPGGTISSDLSGGMDSTSVCFLAAGPAVRDAGRARLITVRWNEIDPGNDDSQWAAGAAAALTNARHLTLGDRGPCWFSELNGTSPPADEPYRWVRARAWVTDLAERMAAEGSRLHMGGHGGDEAFGCTGGYLHDLAWSRPLAALRRARGHRALGRWLVGPTARALADRRTFPEWLAACARALTEPYEPTNTPTIAWGFGPRMPPWATPDAVDAARRGLRRLAGTVEPLAATRGQHQTLDLVRTGGLTVRQIDQVMGLSGVPLAAPLLDDQVVTAALAVRGEDRQTPFQFKPLLAAAVRGLVPDDLLTRRTKGEFSTEFYAGLDRHRAELLGLLDGSLLADLGLIDTGALRSALCTAHPHVHTMQPIEVSLACEIWLRANTAPRPAPARKGEVLR
jgi:asparagine synthase (glutamine-hydrolysing)